MVVGVGATSGLTGLPTQSFTDQTQSGLQTNAQSGNTTNQTQNQFTQGQQGVQGQLGNFISQILSGQGVSQNFGLPQSTWDAAHANFNQFEAPKLALQGSGSPAIASGAQQLDLQLAGMAGQRSFGNALDAFSQAAQFAFKPVGTTGSQAQNALGTQADNTTQNTTQTNVDYGGLLSAVGQLLGGGFQSSPLAPVNPFGSI